MKFEARHLFWGEGHIAILNDMSFSVTEGEFLGIIGPNGAGKSCLMLALSGVRQPSSGTVLLNNCPLSMMTRRDIARQLALVEQQVETSEYMTVRQVVELGRIPHLGTLNLWRSVDQHIVEQAMVDMDITYCANRIWQTLSGGERQRTHIARALAQRPRLLLLDEPTNHLDIGHQLDLMVKIQRMCRHEKLTVVAALHDLNHAALFCDQILALEQGRIVAYGRPRDVLTTDLISHLFHAEAKIMTDLDGTSLIHFYPKSLGEYYEHF